MGKSSSAAQPAVPDPYETASTESQFNRIDTFNPAGGGVRHGYTGPTGEFTSGVAPPGSQSAQSYIESPTELAQREMLEPASLALTDMIVSDNINGMPDAARVQDRSDVADDLFNKNYSLMAPGFEQENDRMLTNLQARGMPVGGEGFNEAYNQQQTTVNESMDRLAMDANLAAGGEQSRQFGLDQAQRTNSIAELVAAFGGGYSPANSTPSGNAAGVNYSGMVGNQYDSQMSQYNAGQQSQNANMGALGSLGGAMLMKCTITAKNVVGPMNVKNASRVMQAIPLATWMYKPEEKPEGDHGHVHVGPMAEDFHALTNLGAPDTINVIDMLGVMSGALQDALWRVEKLEAQLGQKGLH